MAEQFVAKTITKAEIVEQLNIHAAKPLSVDDPRLTDAVCREFAARFPTGGVSQDRLADAQIEVCLWTLASIGEPAAD